MASETCSTFVPDPCSVQECLASLEDYMGAIDNDSALSLKV
jgi:hypothetical protein